MLTSDSFKKSGFLHLNPAMSFYKLRFDFGLVILLRLFGQ
jgi:hypothetical protein